MGQVWKKRRENPIETAKRRRRKWKTIAKYNKGEDMVKILDDGIKWIERPCPNCNDSNWYRRGTAQPTKCRNCGFKW